jgi:thiol-disulfide isomerase/thioredoxin
MHAIDNLGAMVRPAYHYGVFKIGEANFKFALFNYYRNDYTSETAFLCMVPANGSFPPPEASPVYYQQGDVFYLGQKGYRFKSMSKDGSQISIEQLPVNQKNIGADSGLYAIPVQGVDVRSGKNYDLSNAKNYTILDFWGTWCGPCLKMLPDLQAFNEHQERYNFQLVSIAYDQDAKKVRDHILSQGIYWTNLFDDSNNSVITDQYKVSVFPTFILIDKKGKILYRGVGQDGLSKIENILKKDL